eukprot:COSAG02_NODE_158_length_32954_cov_16.416771_33_plen_51_part_00
MVTIRHAQSSVERAQTPDSLVVEERKHPKLSGVMCVHAVAQFRWPIVLER